MHLKSIKNLAVFTLLAVSVSWLGCDSKDPKGPDCNLSNADLSYTKNIKGIIDQHCISCHAAGSGVSGAVGDYRTYEGMKTYLSNGKILDVVVVDKTMPQGGGMSQSQRDSINCWIAADFPK